MKIAVVTSSIGTNGLLPIKKFEFFIAYITPPRSLWEQSIK